MSDVKSELVEQVIDRLSGDCDEPRKAVDSVIEQTDHETLVELGKWALWTAYRQERSHANPEQKIASGKDTTDDDKQTPKNDNPSKFQNVDPKNWYIPIDNTGEQKRFGEWTAGDVQRRIEFLKNLRNSISSKIKTWNKIKEKMVQCGADKIEDVEDNSLLGKVA